MTHERVTNDRDADDVLAVMRRYTDAAFKGDADGLRACFHPDAVMSGLARRPAARWARRSRSSPTSADTRPWSPPGRPTMPTVVSVDVLGRVASVRIDETGFFGAMSFANWFHLLKGDDGQWRIVSKAFMTREA